jgi:MarR family transcriptional regulator for hemolysin
MDHHGPIGLLIAAVRRRIKQLTTERVALHGLSPQQFWTVVGIARSDGISLRALADRRRMDYPTASRIVDALARRGVVKNETDPADRRRSRLVLTPAGKTLARKLLPVATEVRTAVESALTRAERDAVVAGLEKVLASLDRQVAAHERPSVKKRKRSA